VSDVKEWRLKCRICGGVVKAQGTKGQLDEWLEGLFGDCPAGGRHVEIGSRKDYLVVIGCSDELSEVKRWKPDPSKTYVNIHEIPDLKHCGFGVFKDSEGRVYDYEVDEHGRRHYYIAGRL